uniref:Uncharacterized protein n=1 Tax=Heliothis virescens TaxID=7102 RepID=A0A2A4JFQ8_HELVI
MFNSKSVLWFAILLAVLLEPIAGRKGFSGGHSYPKSGGLSGGGHRSGGLSGGGHGYPSSGGSHGYPSSGGSHAYPSSSGGSHGYPASGGLSGSGTGSHGYPSSGGNHAYPSSGGSHTYPSSGSNSHTYPSSGSNSHGYPSGSGLSGNNNRYPQQKPVVHHTTNVYNYHYSPPQRITYTPVRGSPPVSYPVYHGTPPTYIYQYKNSGSKYGTLLAGLALLNLGTLAGAAYANSHNSQSHYNYKPQPGEVCKFAVKRDNGDYEETKIDCRIISSFILQDQGQLRNTGTNSTVSVVTVTNTTVMNMTNMAPNQQSAPVPVPGNPLYQMLPNGTLVPVNATVPVAPPMPTPVPVNPMSMSPNIYPNGTLITSSVVTTTTTNTTLVNALDVKGRPVEVTPGMQCFVIRNSPTSNMRKNVPCGLLQTYAEKSLRRNSATRNVPMFTIVAAIVAVCVAF